MTFGVVIVGLGQIGMGYDLRHSPDAVALTHARAFSRHPAFHLAGGVDPSPESRATFAEHYGRPTFADATSAVAQLQPDVVVVAAPTISHHACVEQAIRARNPTGHSL